ncbi:hypothetical protein CPB84DRAFT_1015231 [Gymnopilus junonius]|uniref:Uncharacterized protein n=1 Tax=Gymnopilus junonius TaxID=109634 RepID=A0A9P5TEH2_GYMJU|nr:hypothetical protein CPB84DRAFT_1015231 [Gymnopilus junonius]
MVQGEPTVQAAAAAVLIFLIVVIPILCGVEGILSITQGFVIARRATRPHSEPITLIQRNSASSNPAPLPTCVSHSLHPRCFFISLVSCVTNHVNTVTGLATLRCFSRQAADLSVTILQSPSGRPR